jgi:hypothetical protein
MKANAKLRTAHIGLCAICNLLLLIAFTALYWYQGRLTETVSKKIDLFVLPCGWLVGFFAATFVGLRKVFPLPILIIASLACSFVFSFLLLFVIGLLFDPMF